MAVEIAIDTNRYRDFVDGNPEVVGFFRSAAMIHLPLNRPWGIKGRFCRWFSRIGE